MKGIQIRGQAITDRGVMGKLERGASDQKTGNIAHLNPQEPKDQRPNCNNNWKRWGLSALTAIRLPRPSCCILSRKGAATFRWLHRVRISRRF